MRRLFAAFLSLALVLGAIPVEAQQFVRPVVLSAPVAAPVAVAPVLPAPALAAPLSAAAAAPALLSAAPAAPALAPAPLAAPASAPPAVLPALSALPATAAPAAAPSAAGSLRGLAAPDAALGAGLVFDGGRTPPAAKDGDPVVSADPVPAAGAPRLDPPARKPKRVRSLGDRFFRAGVVGVGAAALAPALWSAVPASAAMMLFAVAVTPLVAAAVVADASRGVRKLYRKLTGAAAPAPKPAPSRRKVNAVRALGLALGMALAAGTAVHQVPLIEHAHAYMASRLPAEEQSFKTELPKSFGDETAKVLSQTAGGRAALERVRGADGKLHMPGFTVIEARQHDVALRDRYFADSAIAQLSKTAVGRQVLDGLRDRGGVVRMPTFFVSYQKGSAARYTPPDMVLLSVETIEDGGVTVDRFLNDHQLQMDYLQREQAVITHELTHAAQARRSPFNMDAWALIKTDGGRLAAAVEAYAKNRENPAPAGLSEKDALRLGKQTADAGAASFSAGPTVAIDAAVLHREGLTVRQFRYDVKAQHDYIVRHQAELAAALTPAPAAAAAPAAGPSKSAVPIVRDSAVPETAAAEPHVKFSVSFGMVQEWEYEAYITEHLYTHERLASDPGIAMSGDERYGYEQGLQDFDSFLKSIDEPGIYAANFHGRSAYYARFLASQRAGWDAHRVEGYVLLARRDLIQKNVRGARAHLEQARAIAAEKGLPAPTLEIPAR
ncbi:MAG TPA: hypothetical protein VN915_11605 [Elusimicrobiota bacterium]|nr:hypothetical protein [Elusimicrobiota bacterium]